MTTQQQKNRRLIVLIFAMTFVPFFIAVYFRTNPESLTLHTNKGELIIPPETTQREDFIGYDVFSEDNMKELAGHWVLVNIIPTAACATVCLEALHKTKQLILMMNKDLTRMRRVVVLFKDVAPEAAANWWTEDSALLKARASDGLMQKINKIRQLNTQDGLLILMDPFGNLMMQYEPGFDPYKVKDDLRKLLMTSQIG